MLSEYLFDTKFAGRLILALRRAVAAQFTETDWMELGYETGQHDYIQSHARLLRSLHFGDDDYGDCVFQVLKYFSEQDPAVLQTMIDHKKVRRQLERDAPELLAHLGLNVAHVPTVAPNLLSTSEVVERALADADSLLHTNGPISCVDRLHTALHGYLRSLCNDAGIAVQEGAPITALFKQLRSEHPGRFSILAPKIRTLFASSTVSVQS